MSGSPVGPFNKPRKPVPSDLEIAQEAPIDPILAVAERVGLSADDLDLYGKYKAKVHLDVRAKFKDRPQGKYIDVTAITPTPLGEGKTTTTVGLSQGLGRIGKKVFTCIRQPSQGPTFGIKGGAAGGGYSQVIPMEDFNLHLTGDIHAVAAAHNLMSAAIDNHIHHGNELKLNPFSVTWPRVVDLNDRALRNVVCGLGGKENGYPRESGFDIAVASEVMAILALATDLNDLRQRLARIVVGTTFEGRPVTAEDLKVAGAMTVLLNEALALRRGDQALWLAGIDDPHYYRADNLEKTCERIPEDAVSVLLAHSPEIFRNAAHAGFDVMLCGHTHGGQVCLPGGVPLYTNARCPRALCAGAWRFGDLIGYTSAGSGVSVSDVRFNCPPEITVHRLTRKGP